MPTVRTTSPEIAAGPRRRRPTTPAAPDIEPIDTSEYLDWPTSAVSPPPVDGVDGGPVSRPRSLYLDDDLWDRFRGVIAAANDGRLPGVSKTFGGAVKELLDPWLTDLERTHNEARPFPAPAGRLPTGRKD